MKNFTDLYLQLLIFVLELRWSEQNNLNNIYQKDERINHCLTAIYYKLVIKDELKTVLSFKSFYNKFQIAKNDTFQYSLNQSYRHNQQHFKPNFATFRFQSALQLGPDLKHHLHAPFSPLLGSFLGCVRRDVEETSLELENRFGSFKGME
ncbi:Hypothetical_protein [Hexamita inflata]|uniref:Hypothetical_protein n=1 Tax=Hexamita inflata TaxID=28002 RepID=A0AA86NIW9_9EUKA|nr:Hypothetical protein HINF_LOCUS7715 [Hexamita inflata]